MKSWEKEIKQAQLDREKQVYAELEQTYKRALQDVQKRSNELQKQIDKLVEADPENETLVRSKIYQLKYQETIKAQLDDAMKRLNDASSITAYMEDMYKEGYASQFYALQKQGVPVLAPINHEKMLTALTYPTANMPLSTRLYNNVEKTKKQILSEISRGIASGMSGQDVARNIQNRMGVSYRKARQLAQNEGHRVNTQACMDGMHAAKDRGADIVKQWDCTYDKKTRPQHAELDQKWVEIDDYFEYSGGKVFAPKQFGIPRLDINCRCALLSVPRWDVDSDTPKHYDNIEGEIIEAKNYAEWKEKYYNISKENSVDKDVSTQRPKANANPLNFDDLEMMLLDKYDIKMDSKVKELDFASVKDAISGIETVINEYPELGESLKMIKTESSGIMACVGNEITFNPKYFGNRESLIETLDRNAATGWFPKNTSIQSIGVHESAHGVEWLLIQNNSEYIYDYQKVAAWNKCTEAKKIVSQACKNIKKTEYGKGKKNKELIESISKYAGKNQSETLAEAFNDAFANSNTSNPLAIEIKRLTMETYKKYKGG
jgi:uncharacterized protein with gpF-like domain